MLGAGVHFELFEHATPELIFWEHALNGMFDKEFGATLALFGRRAEFLPAGISRVSEVGLVRFFEPGEARLFRIHHDHKVAAIHVRRKEGPVLTAEDARYFGGESPNNFVGGINYIPIALDGVGLYAGRLEAIRIHCLKDFLRKDGAGRSAENPQTI